jgi:pimeloyl-ACP methyl ester carboxylesterase
MEQKEITINGKKLSYRCQGEGPVVVLIHGFGEDGTVWQNQYEAFPALKLIIPDLPGSGRSDMIDDMSMEGLAESVKALIEHETASLFFKEGEPHSVIMIGHSMGGYITLAFAEKYHHMLRGFGLFHSTAFADSEEKKQIRQKGIRFIQTHGPFEFLKTSIPNLFSPVTKEKKALLIEDQINASHNFSAAALVSYYVSMINRPDRTEVLKQTHLPVLFVLGKYDTAVPIKEGLEQSYLPELSYIHILNESGHMGMIEERVETDRILKNYIASVTKTTQPE